LKHPDFTQNPCGSGGAGGSQQFSISAIASLQRLSNMQDVLIWQLVSAAASISSLLIA
jgi:hypothetical protein